MYPVDQQLMILAKASSDVIPAPLCTYNYSMHGDAVDLTDANGTTVATYSYGTFGTPTIWGTFTNGWPYYACFSLGA